MSLANESFTTGDRCRIDGRAAINWLPRRRPWLWLVLLCLSLARLAPAAEGAPKAQLIVGSELNFPPFVLVREGGRPDGFAVELWQAVARDAHLDAKIETGLFHENLARFKSGEIDVLVNLAPSDERHRFADFSVPHVRMTGAVFTRKGDSGITSEDDLAKKSLIVIKFDSAHEYARTRGWTNLTVVDRATAGMELLAKSTTHDAMLVGRLVGLNTARTLKLDDKIRPLAIQLGYQQKFAFAVAKGQTELLEKINEALANVRASGEYAAIYAKWFGSLEPQPIMENLLRYLVPAFLAILLLGGGYLHERSLRVRWRRTAAELEEAHMALTNAMPGIARLDTEGHYLQVNDMYAGMLGYEPAELIGTDWARTVHSEDGPAALAAYERMVEVGKGEFEARAVRKDGANFSKQVLMVKIVDDQGRHVGHHCFMRDISERKAVERALLDSEAKLRRVADAVPGVLYQYRLGADGQQRLLSVSEGIKDLVNCSAAQVLADFSLLWEPILPEDRQMLWAATTRSAETLAPWEFEWRMRAADESLKWIRGHAVAEPRGADGSIVWNGILTDVTERKRDETEIARLAAIVETSGDAIISRDLDFKITSWNVAAERLFGYPAVEVIGQRTDLLIPPERFADVERRRNLIHDSAQPPTVDSVWLKRGGAPVDVSVTQSPIKDRSGKLIGVSLSVRDISARKLAEFERTRLAAIVENSGDAIVSRDLDLKILTWNAAAERMFGYPAEEVVGRTIDMFNPPDRQTLVLQRRGLINQGLPSVPVDTVWVAYDGRRIDVSVSQSPIRDAAGQLISVSLIVRDISERKRTEKSLRLTQFGVDRAVDPMFWIGADGAVLYANDIACALYGYDHAELLTKTALDLSPSRRREEWSLQWESLKQQRAVTFEAQHRTKNGALFDAEVTVNYIEHEGEEFHCTIVRDISARKRAELALRTSEEQFRAAFEVSSVGMSQADPATGKLLRVNRRFCAMTGYSEAELLSRTFSDITHPDDRAADMAKFAQLVSGEVESFSFEKRYLRKDGGTIWGEISVNLIRDDDGVARRAMAVIQDITERKRAEIALRASEERYARATSAGTVGVWDLDYRTGVYTTDANLKAMFGYGPDELDPDPYRWLELVHPDDRAIAMATSQAVVEGRAEKYVCDLRMICKDGSIKWADVRGDVERAADGSVTRMTGTTVDVTARRQAEQAVQVSERSIRRLYRITNATDLPFAERVRELLKLGCERFAIPYGFLTKVQGEELEITFAHAPDGAFAEGTRIPLDAAFCNDTMKANEPICYEHVGASEWRDHPGYLALGMECYLGTKIVVNQITAGTICFLGAQPHGEPFTEAERDFLKLMAVWVSGELDRYQAHEQLQRAHDHMRQVIDVDPNFIFAKDRAGRFTLVNKAVADAYGTTVENLVGKTDADFNPNAAEVEFYRQKDLEVMDSLREAFIEEETITDATGKTRWLQTVKRPILDDSGRATQVLGAATDITARKLVEETLRESDHDLRAAQSIAHLGSWSWDIPSGRNSWSDENYRLFGYEPGTVEPNYDTWFNRIHPDDRNAVLAHLDAVFAGTTDYDIEYRAVPRDDEVRHVHALGELVRDDSGAPLRMAGTVLDITERKRAEAALRRAYDGLERRVEERTAELRQAVAALSKTEALLQQAVDVADLGVFERDHVADEVYYSPSLCGILHLSGDDTGKLGSYLSRVHVDDRDMINAARQRAHDPLGHGFFSVEHRIVRPDGSVGWVINRAQTVFEGSGASRQAVRTVGAVLDITERKRAEELLRKNQEWLNQAVTVANLGVFEHDFIADELSFSPAFRRMLDWPDELTPTSGEFRRRLHPEDSQRINSAIRDAHASSDGNLAIEYRIIRRDGSIGWLLVRAQMFFDGAGATRRLLRSVGTALDITERKQAEEALRESEARLRAILDHSPAPVFIKDTAGRYVHVNRRFEELFEIPVADSIGKTDADLFAAEQAALFQRHDRQVFDSGTAIQCEEVAQYDDGEHTSLVNKFPLRDGEGVIYGLCGIATDITERKRAEAALRKLSEALDRRVIERTQELADSQARLRALVADLSKTEERERRRLAVELHDYLAQMLTVCRLNIGRAVRLADGDALKQRLSEAQESVDESIAYTRSLMAQLSPRVLYELGLPAALSWLAGQQKERHGLEVEVRGRADGFSLEEDRAVLAFQCVRELLWNVVKHAEASRVTVTYRLEQGELNIEVADDGRGFDPAIAQSRAGGTEQFGLFSIRERLELFGGRLEVSSQPGQGTTVRFSFAVPASDRPPDIERHAVPTDRIVAAAKRINVALVDDHAVVRRGLRQALEKFADFNVVGEAEDGPDGVALARQLRPDVIVMDINMPGMNGVEATRLILQEMPATIVVGLSFEIGREVAQAMKDAGAVTCVTKERAVEDIHQAIIDAVEERRGVTH